MIHAYDEQYLNDAMENLGEAFDYAVNSCKINADNFMDLFVASGLAYSFERGNPKFVSGLSGTELVMEVVSKSHIDIPQPKPQIEYNASVEYWSGWILAFYQWYTTMSFRDIHSFLSMDDIMNLYNTHHEAAEEKFVDTANSIILKKKCSTKLQSKRKLCGYSQKELAEKTGVNIRTLQQYETGLKDINKASVKAVVALANALGCEVDDLLEPENKSE